MDFGTLLQTAKQNESIKKEVRSYSTKFAPPKKEDKKDKILSANIKKFLARKENEEKKKSLDANRKREELLALRSQDKKATRRVNVMLKRTKSANQSVIDDAVDNDNTAVTLAGPAQPDEDDYGYVSQEASAFYNKMMEKYNKMPEEQKFPDAKKRASANLSSTKDRVKAALEKEKLEAMLPHRRKRKHKEDDEADQAFINDTEYDEPYEKSEPPPKLAKPKNKGPPPINFAELLKLASQKQHEPIMVEVKPKEEELLFTKKQKHELEKEQQRRLGNEKGKLSVDQITEIRKLPPSHLYRTKKRKEVSQAEVYESRDDSDDYEEPSSSSTNSIPNVQNERSMFNKKDVPNERITKGPRDSPITNNIPKRHNQPNSSGAQMSKPYNDTRGSKPYPEKTHADSRLSSKTSNSTPAQPQKACPQKPSNSIRIPKTANERYSDSKLPEKVPKYETNSKPTSNNDRFREPKLPEKVTNANRIPKFESNSKSANNKPSIDNRPAKNLEKPKIGNQVPSSSKISASNDYRPSTSKLKTQLVGSQKPNGALKTQASNNQARIPDRNNKSYQEPQRKHQLERKQFPSNDRRPMPQKDLKPKQFPPPDVVRRKECPPNNARSNKLQIVNKRRIIDDDDEEYDSEMDDFIDDGPEETNDYSTYIREIFGYDKRKYKTIDDEDDVDNMESTFAQQMREDVRSTRIGIMEDLEDMKKEKQEKKIKMLKKKGRL